MKKSMMLQGMVAALAVVLMVGCATTGGSSSSLSPQEASAQTVAQWADALKAQDIDAIMATFSEDFEHFDWGDKAGATDFMSEAIEMGYLEDIEVDLSEAEYELDEDLVAVYPIEIIGNFGEITLELLFAKGANGYQIVGMDAAGL